MMIALFLLGAFVCTGLSAEYKDYKDYGDSKLFWLSRKTQYIEFIPMDKSNVTVVWKEGDPVISADRRVLKTVLGLQLSRVTQKDSGRYIVRDKDQNELATHVLEVKGNTRNYERKHGDSLRIFFNIDQTACNIYFFPESKRRPRESKIEVIREGRPEEGLEDFGCVGFEPFMPCGISSQSLRMSCNGRFEIRDQNDNTALKVTLAMKRKEQHYERRSGDRLSFALDLEQDSCNINFIPEIDDEPGKKIEVVRGGRLQWGIDRCAGFELLRPCGISNDDLQYSCKGYFEVRDQNGDEALQVTLEMEEPESDEISSIGIGAGIFFAGLFSCCVRFCCCGGSSSSKEDGSEPAAEPADGPAAAPAAAPAARHQERENEPVGPSQNQLIEPSWTPYPPAPFYSTTDPLIHCRPTVDPPPPYSEASALTEQTDPPPFSLHSDPEPRFDLRGLTFPSAPPDSDVYNSDKLNFL